MKFDLSDLRSLDRLLQLIPADAMSEEDLRLESRIKEEYAQLEEAEGLDFEDCLSCKL